VEIGRGSGGDILRAFDEVMAIFVSGTWMGCIKKLLTLLDATQKAEGNIP
jgi:hypothetical protein